MEPLCDPCFFFFFQIKTGAPCRSERLAKYNQLMRCVFIAWLARVRAYVETIFNISYLFSSFPFMCHLLFHNLPSLPLPLRIEEELGEQARYAGHNFRNPSALWVPVSLAVADKKSLHTLKKKKKNHVILPRHIHSNYIVTLKTHFKALRLISFPQP